MLWTAIAVTIALVVGYTAARLLFGTDKTVSDLGEACLAARLAAKCRADFDVLNRNYSSYDGSRLPPMAGYNTFNAFTTYISHGGSKSAAIRAYLHRNLRTEEQVTEFLRGGEEQPATSPPGELEVG